MFVGLMKEEPLNKEDKKILWPIKFIIRIIMGRLHKSILTIKSNNNVEHWTKYYMSHEYFN